ncbi:MAG TPA: long-chain-fatty-acid--CoA ligase [Spirochaetia bacterium]|nr:long-chain-fatty-acid--CoA ligase [Spirochaetia bacterium]
MLDKSKRYMKTCYALDNLSTLQGKRIYFDSMAEMVLVRAQEIPDHVHSYYYDEVVTYAQTNERSNKVANYLKKKGLHKGDIVSVMIMNSPAIYYTMFGAQKLGCIAGAINYMLKGPEIAYILDDSKPKVAFVSSEFMPEFARGYEMAKHKPIVVEEVTDVQHDARIAQTTLAEVLSGYPADEALIPQSLSDPFLLLYTSGTTGYPKGVLLSNGNQFANCKDMARFGVTNPDDVFMIVAPMFHTNPLCVWTYPYTYQGLSLVIRKRFSPDEFWPSLQRWGVTIVWGVPAMYMYVLNQIDPTVIDHSKLKLRYAFSGGAPIPPELIRDFRDKFSVQVIDGYGLTEVTGVSTSSLGAPLKTETIGQHLFEQEVEIMDDNNNVLPYGEVGEVCMKGEAVMIGYLNKPEATAETIKEGWLHTGDLGYMDDEGYLFFTGRKKEMINRGGENIYPREIERVLEGHPKIAEVAVVGVPDPALGERVKACVVLKEPQSMMESDIKAYLEDKIAKYKLPEFVELYSALPRNPSGKVLRAELKTTAPGQE